MKFDFAYKSTRRDLKLLEWQRGSDGHERVKVEDVLKVFERWIKAFEDEETMTESEQRFQDLLHKEGKFTKMDFQEATQLMMFIHKPLIRGHNDVVGVRLRDADYIRLQNRVLGFPLEQGIADFNAKVEEIEAAERKRKAAERAKKKKQESESEFLVVRDM